ncbi:MAG: ABC transporter ATP-binding protein [bacterium]
MEKPPLLSVDDLTIAFRSENQETRATDQISFHLGSSETLGIVGESGSGKTVTALSILRLLPSPPAKVLSGRIIFNDKTEGKKNILSLSEEEMRKIRGRKISMIFQEPMTSLNPVFTCGDQVAEILRQHLIVNKSEAKERVLELFHEVRLPEPRRVFAKYPHELSGGQKQRVMIAMAIACSPGILIADEPTTALDVTVQKTILELLQRLQDERKMSILFITHDLGLISSFARRVVVMYKGKVVEEGEVGNIFKNPQHRYTQGLIACRPPLSARLRRLPMVEDFINGMGGEVQVISPKEREAEHGRIYASEPVLKVAGLGKKFHQHPVSFFKKENQHRVLSNIALSVFQGETLGIVGESGSGKTTLARTMLELIPPSEGSILYLETEITTLNRENLKKLRKDLQIIFQDPYSSLNPRRTIGAAIMEPMVVHKILRNNAERRAETIRLLRQVGLEPHHFDRYPHEFSGGQRQRICIARAIAVRPRLIICDEPVSALDVSIQAQVLNLLNDLKSQLGLTYIFISHDLSVVKYMADRLIVMKEGKIVEMGDADQIYKNPREEYTRLLLEAIPGQKSKEP